MYQFGVFFSANDSVFRAEHDPLLRTAYFLSKTRVLRVRKKGSTLKLQARYVFWSVLGPLESFRGTFLVILAVLGKTWKHNGLKRSKARQRCQPLPLPLPTPLSLPLPMPMALEAVAVNNR